VLPQACLCAYCTDIAHLKGETVIDLGSGAGFDVFLAANKVGSAGNVYGIDMNKASDDAQIYSSISFS